MSEPLSVLFVPSGPSRIASARIRAFQYIEPLRRVGVRCAVFPAMSELTARLRVASPHMSRFGKLAYYTVVMLDKACRLIPILILAARYDVIYLQRTTFPIGVPALLRWINPCIVFDFDDAIQLRDPGDRETGIVAAMKERMKRRAVPAILSASRCAIVEHGVLEAYAREHCERVETIPGPVDSDLFVPKAGARSPGAFVIGWIGTPLTSSYLPIVEEALRRIASRHVIEVHLIGGGEVVMPGVPVKVFSWAESEEVQRLQSFDVGIMPMPDSDWTRGKLGLKMLLYMAVGIPAVVSYTPVNAEVITDGVNGFIASDVGKWESTLEALIVNSALRERIARAGRQTAEGKYSLRAAVPKLLAILQNVAAPAKTA